MKGELLRVQAISPGRLFAARPRQIAGEINVVGKGRQDAGPFDKAIEALGGKAGGREQWLKPIMPCNWNKESLHRAAGCIRAAAPQMTVLLWRSLAWV